MVGVMAHSGIEALADFFENFYVFDKICVDPAASEQSGLPSFLNPPVYGSADGGGVYQRLEGVCRVPIPDVGRGSPEFSPVALVPSVVGGVSS